MVDLLSGLFRSTAPVFRLVVVGVLVLGRGVEFSGRLFAKNFSFFNFLSSGSAVFRVITPVLTGTVLTRGRGAATPFPTLPLRSLISGRNGGVSADLLFLSTSFATARGGLRIPVRPRPNADLSVATTPPGGIRCSGGVPFLPRLSMFA